MAILCGLAPAESGSKYCRPIAVLNSGHRYHGCWCINYDERHWCTARHPASVAGLSAFGASAFLGNTLFNVQGVTDRRVGCVFGHDFGVVQHTRVGIDTQRIAISYVVLRSHQDDTCVVQQADIGD